MGEGGRRLHAGDRGVGSKWDSAGGALQVGLSKLVQGRSVYRLTKESGSKDSGREKSCGGGHGGGHMVVEVLSG